MIQTVKSSRRPKTVRMMVRKSMSKFIPFLRHLVSLIWFLHEVIAKVLIRLTSKLPSLPSCVLVSNSRQRDKKKTRFNDPKERTSSILLTHVHVGMMDTSKTASDNGTSTAVFTPLLPVSVKKEKSKKRDVSPSSSSSSSSGRQKKPKKHKKSSKHSKKSSRKRDRSRSRDYDRDKRKTYKSDRRSMESKSSVRSSESRRRSRSRSRSRDRHRSRKY